jgi:hypothetical protein
MSVSLFIRFPLCVGIVTPHTQFDQFYPQAPQRRLSPKLASTLGFEILTELYRRRDFGHMDLEITFNDPKYYTRPFSLKTGLNLIPDSDLLEYVCNENEKDRPHLVKLWRDVRVISLSVIPPASSCRPGSDCFLHRPVPGATTSDEASFRMSATRAA